MAIECKIIPFKPIPLKNGVTLISSFCWQLYKKDLYKLISCRKFFHKLFLQPTYMLTIHNHSQLIYETLEGHITTEVSNNYKFCELLTSDHTFCSQSVRFERFLCACSLVSICQIHSHSRADLHSQIH